jgi:FMN-dependent NADH-azoreductase
MSHLLQINSSVFSQGGQSSQLAAQYVATWKTSHPGASVTLRDLATDPVPHLDGARVGAFFTPADHRSPEQKDVIAYSDALIAELRAADTVVISAPMYNFGIPSTLKAYFDHVARAGETFRYTANGPIGLLTGKKVVIFSTRGGLYQGTPRDTQSPYLREFLGFLGMTDISFVTAEGLALGDEQKAAALADARKALHSLAA